jgi:phytoene dehydrogenase-like protein
MKSYDAIIIGGGHNGLTCAAYLAKAGRDVLVLEQRAQVGGAAITEETVPGFKFSACSYVISLLRPWIIRDLDLMRHGMEILPLDSTFTPYPDGRYLLRDSDPGRTRRNMAEFSKHDAEVYPQFGLRMGEMSRLVKDFVDNPAFDPTSMDPREWLDMLRLGRGVTARDAAWTADHLKLLTMSASDFLAETFECDQIIAPMSVSGIIGTFQGVRSPGTAYVLLHHYMGDIDGAYRAWGLSKGGNGQVSRAIASAATEAGAEIRTLSPVDHVLMQNDRAVGVVLADGEEIRARKVISACDPHRTFLKLVGEDHLPDELLTQVQRFKMRGSTGKVNLALDALPEFSCLPPGHPDHGLHLRGGITIAPSTEYLERAYDEAKYGAFSKRPFLDIVIPTLTDPSMAPPGKHVMSVFVQYAPYNLSKGPDDWPNQRDAFYETVIDTLAEYIPNIRDIIVGKLVLTPWDLEQEYGLTEGNIFHGELSLEQLAFLRPMSGWSRYKTPIKDLWMCASGTHPGGGVMGAPGALCARTLLKSGVR